MATGKVEVLRMYTLILTEVECAQLKNLLQNPIGGMSNEVRESIWQALNPPESGI